LSKRSKRRKKLAKKWGELVPKDFLSEFDPKHAVLDFKDFSVILNYKHKQNKKVCVINNKTNRRYFYRFSCRFDKEPEEFLIEAQEAIVEILEHKQEMIDEGYLVDFEEQEVIVE
jgi:uncharacterized protein (UPF0218 family)